MRSPGNKPLLFLPALAAWIWASAASGFGDRDAAALAAMADLAGDQTGVVCWQSRHTGSLRIFACDLDGANLRQVSPETPGKDHLGPLISPDGTRIIYFQTVLPLEGANYYSDHVGDLMVVDADDTDGSSAELLVSGARTYFECRVARWLDDDRIAYIGSDHHGYIYSISQDSSSKLFDYPYDEFGAFPNRQLTHAIDGKNRVFTIHNPGSSGTLTEEQDYDGCEGNMSHDGLWAYRVKGGWPGHDFMRMRLGSWEEEMFFECLSSTLPADQNYIYFPQVSLNQQILSMGVSRDRSQHDHWDSDYDIFLVRIDPVTFLETGAPVKYSFSDALDAYPDVWVRTAVRPPELELDPEELTFGAVLDGSAPDPRPVTVSNPGTGTLDPVTAAEDVSWLTVGVSGSGNDQILTVAVDPASLAAGTYPATVELTCPNAVNSPVSYPVTLTVSQSGLPVKINCGSNDHDVAGWTRDDDYVTGGADWVNSNTVDTSGVANAAPVGVYQSVRHQSPHSYDIPVPDGSYLLRLHFADAYTDRSMDYTAEGQSILSGFDIVTEAGAVNRALVKEFAITVSDGNGLQIEASSTGDVLECGIEILSDLPEEPRPDGDAGTGDEPVPDGDAGTGDSGGTADGTDENVVSGGCGGCHPTGPGTAGPGMIGLFLSMVAWWGLRRRAPTGKR